jgi:hypothetical protein
MMSKMLCWYGYRRNGCDRHEVLLKHERSERPGRRGGGFDVRGMATFAVEWMMVTTELIMI